MVGRTASVSAAVYSGLIPSWVKPITVILVFTASRLDAQHQRNSVENKATNLLFVPMGKHLAGFFILVW